MLGTAQLVQAYGITGSTTARSAGDATALLRRARELGIRRLDTAAAYGDAELAIGVSGLPFVVDTKVAKGSAPAQSLKESLERLQMDTVQVLYLHDPVCLHEVGRETIRLAAATIGRGAQRIGVSVYEPADTRLALGDPWIGAIQLPANLLDRRTTDILNDESASIGTHLFVRSVFLQGALLAPPGDVDRRVPGLGRYVGAVQQLAHSLCRPVQQLAVQWARSLPGVQGVIVGTDSESQLEQLAKAWDAPRLDQEELELVARLPAPPPRLIDPRTWAG